MAAFTLGIDLSFISVKASNNIVTPNNSVTGGSVSSESCAYVRNHLIHLQHFAKDDAMHTKLINNDRTRAISVHNSGLQGTLEETRADQERIEGPELEGARFDGVSKGC